MYVFSTLCECSLLLFLTALVPLVLEICLISYDENKVKFFSLYLTNLCLDSECSHWVQSFFSQLFSRLNGQFSRSQGSSQSAGLFRPQVLRLVAFVPVIFSQVVLLSLVDNRENSCNRFTYYTTERYKIIM